MTIEIARLINESGKTLQRRWSLIAPHLDLDGTNLITGVDGPLTALLDMGAGLDAFTTTGRSVVGIATRAQYHGICRTLTWRNRSTRSELSRQLEAYLAGDGRLGPVWCIHVYEDPPERKPRRLHGFVAVRSADLARYYLAGHPVRHLENGEDGTPFVAFYVSELMRHGVDVRSWWRPQDGGQQRLWESTP